MNTDKTETAVAKVETAAPIKTTRKDVNKALTKLFINTTSIAEILHLGMSTGRNVLLWGPGGHAKSEMTEEFFKHVGIDPFVQALGEGSTEDLLLGGLDIKEFQESGKILYNVENSFMNFEYVVFEELLDCPAQVLLRLKDILTSGYFRNGTQKFKIKTKLIICLTNRSREEVAEDRSIQALMERFPLEYEVKWASYDIIAYNTLYKKVFNIDEGELTSSGLSLVVVAAVASNREIKQILSPRTMVYAAEAFKVCTEQDGLSIKEALDNLKYFSGFTNKGILEAKEQIKHMEEIKKDREIIEASEKIIDQYFDPERIKQFAAMDTNKQKTIIIKLEDQYETFKFSDCTDENADYKKRVLDKIENLLKTVNAIHSKNTKGDKESA